MNTRKDDSKSDYDSGWKEVIENYFQDFLAFFFPHAHRDIDFSLGYEFLDKEFSKIVKQSEQGKRYVDKLVKVFLKDGAEQWILIHIEVHGYEEKDFEKRLYVYNYRIFDRYDKEVITFVILTDEDESYLPEVYQVKRWGFEHFFTFPAVKLICYRERIDLDKASHPFELITFAHLKNLETKNNLNERLFWKITLVKLLYKKGYSKQDILNLYRFIDWVMGLPEDLSERFNDEILTFEEESKMPYITTAERIGIKKGEDRVRQVLQETIGDLLKIKFKVEDDSIKAKLMKLNDIDMLKQIKELIMTSPYLEEIDKAIEQKLKIVNEEK